MATGASQGRPLSQECKHEYRFCAWTGMPVRLCFQCTRCESRVERRANKREARVIGGRDMFALHDVWNKFQNAVLAAKHSEPYDKILAAERFAKKHPRDVRLVTVDDSYFCGSALVLVEHRTKDEYMGTSVVFLPQCNGDDPATFFLYPRAREELATALRATRRAAAAVITRQRRADAARRKRLRALRF